MSPSLPVISGAEAIRALKGAGFRFVRQKGSHIILRRDQPFAQLTVPDHSAATAATKAKSSTIPPELYTLSKQFLRRNGTRPSIGELCAASSAKPA